MTELASLDDLRLALDWVVGLGHDRTMRRLLAKLLGPDPAHAFAHDASRGTLVAWFRDEAFGAGWLVLCLSPPVPPFGGRALRLTVKWENPEEPGLSLSRAIPGRLFDARARA